MLIRQSRATNIGYSSYKVPMKIQNFTLLFLFSSLFYACSECACRVTNGNPNFSVKMSYKLGRTGFSVFQNDTVALKYTVTLNEGTSAEQVFVGEQRTGSNGNKRIQWYNGNTGEETGIETSESLERCLKLENWQGNSGMKEELINSINPSDSLPKRVELMEEH